MSLGSKDRSFAREAVSGSAWTSMQVAVSKAAAAAATFALGFLLKPSDFGIAWFAISAGGLATGLHVLAAFDVLMASPRGMRRIAGPIQAMALVTAIAEMIVVATLGLVLSRLYPDRDGLLALMLVVSIRPIMDAANVLPMARMRLELEYQKLALLDGTATLIGSLASVCMALAGAGPASIVIPPIAATGLRAILYWWHTGAIATDWRAGRRRNALMVRFLLAAFGSYITGVLLILDTTILGLFVSPSSLGLFAFAASLGTQVNGIVSYQIAGSLHPIFAHLRNDPARQIDGLLRAGRLISSVLVPILLVQAAVAGPTFRLIWGDQWRDAAPILVAISIAQSFNVTQWPASFTLKAQGRFRGFLKLQLLQVFIAAGLGSLAAAFGAPAVSAALRTLGLEYAPDASAPLAVAIASAVLLGGFGPLTLWLACRPVGIKRRAILAVTLRPWLAASVPAIGAACVARVIESAAVPVGVRVAMVLGAAAVAAGTGIGVAVGSDPSVREDARALLKRLPMLRTRGSH
jgi:O-antigen/teichoic acid export membrane protein